MTIFITVFSAISFYKAFHIQCFPSWMNVLNQQQIEVAREGSVTRNSKEQPRNISH